MKFINKIKSLFWEAEKEEKTLVRKTSVIAPPKNVIKTEKKKNPKKTRAGNYTLNKRKKLKIQKLSRRGNR